MSGVLLRSGGSAREVRVEGDAGFLDGRRIDFGRRLADGRLAGIAIDGREHRVLAVSEGRRVFVWCDGTVWSFERVAATRTAGSRDHGQDLISPMPGRVRRTLVADGERVARGQALLVLEAMKMEHSIRAPSDGTVRLRVREGDLVEAGVELAQIE